MDETHLGLVGGASTFRVGSVTIAKLAVGISLSNRSGVVGTGR